MPYYLGKRFNTTKMSADLITIHIEYYANPLKNGRMRGTRIRTESVGLATKSHAKVPMKGMLGGGVTRE